MKNEKKAYIIDYFGDSFDISILIENYARGVIRDLGELVQRDYCCLNWDKERLIKARQQAKDILEKEEWKNDDET